MKGIIQCALLIVGLSATSEAAGLRHPEHIEEHFEVSSRQLFTQKEWMIHLMGQTMNGDIYNGQIENKNFWFGGDEMAVVNEKGYGKTCWINGRDSNDTADWWNNIQTGEMGIKDSYYYVTRKKCGWIKHGWYPWYSCTNVRERIQDKGFKGFVESFNAMSDKLAERVKIVCKDMTTYRYVGFSRGGGLAQIAALQHYRRGISKGKIIEVWTLNSPNGLSKTSARALMPHIQSGANYKRYIKKMGIFFFWVADPVSSLPLGYHKPMRTIDMECPGAENEIQVHQCGGWEDWN